MGQFMVCALYLNKAVRKLCVYTVYAYGHPDTKSIVYTIYKQRSIDTNIEKCGYKHANYKSAFCGHTDKIRWVDSTQDPETLEYKR